LSSSKRFGSLSISRLLTEPFMYKSLQLQTDGSSIEIDRRYQYVPSEHTPIRNTFERIRTQLAQEAEQKSRPVSRLYSSLRAIKP
jgi:hypothetical protein